MVDLGYLCGRIIKTSNFDIFTMYRTSDRFGDGTEDTMFFIYDDNYIQGEDQFVGDAILYFSPEMIKVDVRNNLCANIVFLNEFMKGFDDSSGGVSVVTMQDMKIAVEQVEQYIVALSGNLADSDEILTERLHAHINLFRFYHGSFQKFKQTCEAEDKDFKEKLGIVLNTNSLHVLNNDAQGVNVTTAQTCEAKEKEKEEKRKKFKEKLAAVWDYFLPYMKQYGDTVLSGFGAIPTVKISPFTDKEIYTLCLSYLEEMCSSVRGVRGGCVLYRSSSDSTYGLACSQFHADISSRLCVLRPKQKNPVLDEFCQACVKKILDTSDCVPDLLMPNALPDFPGKRANDLGYELFQGVNMYTVYLTQKEYNPMAQFDYLFNESESRRHSDFSRTISVVSGEDCRTLSLISSEEYGGKGSVSSNEDLSESSAASYKETEGQNNEAKCDGQENVLGNLRSNIAEENSDKTDSTKNTGDNSDRHSAKNILRKDDVSTLKDDVFEVDETSNITHNANTESINNLNISDCDTTLLEEEKDSICDHSHMNDKTQNSFDGMPGLEENVNTNAQTVNGSEISKDAEDMIEMNLYVHGCSDTVVILLLEKETASCENTVKLLWEHGVHHIGDLEMMVKDIPDSCYVASDYLRRFTDSKGQRYKYLVYDEIQRSLSGEVLRPSTSEDFEFCSACFTMNQQFLKSGITSEIFLRKNNTIYGGIQMAGRQFFCSRIHNNSIYPGSHVNTLNVIKMRKLLKSALDGSV